MRSINASVPPGVNPIAMGWLGGDALLDVDVDVEDDDDVDDVMLEQYRDNEKLDIDMLCVM